MKWVSTKLTKSSSSIGTFLGRWWIGEAGRSAKKKRILGFNEDSVMRIYLQDLTPAGYRIMRIFFHNAKLCAKLVVESFY